MNYDEDFSRRIHQLARRLGVDISDDLRVENQISLAADVELFEAIIDRLPPARRRDEPQPESMTFAGYGGREIRVEPTGDGDNVTLSILQDGTVVASATIGKMLATEMADFLDRTV